MRYYLYVLRSTRADRLYIGSSTEPDERLKIARRWASSFHQSLATLGACFTCHVIPPAVENVVAFDSISRIITRKNIQTALPLRKEALPGKRLAASYQCAISSMFYAAPWWRVCTWEAPLNPTPAWDRTMLGEFVPPKRGDPGSVFYLPRDFTCGGKRGRVWFHQQDHHAKEYQDRATAEKRERYLKSGWGRKELAVFLERWQSG